MMIHDKEYVRALIRKQMDGALTARESALLKAARKIQGKAEWQGMVLEVLEVVNEANPPERLAALRPDFAGIVERAERQRRIDRIMGKVAKYGMVAAVLAAVSVGFWMYQRHVKIRLETEARCGGLPANAEVPVSSFASSVGYGNSPNIRVRAGAHGSVAHVGNLEVHRDRSGTFVLTALREATASDTAGHPSIRFITAAHEQSEVRLPDGSRIRLNAGSELVYPLLASKQGMTYVRLRGEALVRVEGRAADGPLVIETANAQLHATDGEFAVLATAADTRATLLSGRLQAVARQGHAGHTLKRRGSEVHVRWVRGLDGQIDESLGCRKRGRAEETVAWTKAVRSYRNASLREFVQDISRWHGLRVKDIHCIPESMRVSARVCHSAPLDEALAVINKAGLRVHHDNGMYSFCDSDDAFRPSLAWHGQTGGTCSGCGFSRAFPQLSRTFP